MHHDDEPLATAGNPGAIGLAPAAAVDEHLFEDILDLEGALRLTTQATAGIGAPRAGEIEALGWRVPNPTAARLLALATEIRTATQSADVLRVREAQLAVIDALVGLRAALWRRESQD
ncbi:hypothetical protein [Novosphingobium gossypii]|uniref:hypothetical protein n=1 Tax=Novosphingobium gossypii TaxID=1604774 RepID=UPI003D22EC1E